MEYRYITYSVDEFKTRLSYESWESVFSHNESANVDILFNSFLNDYLGLFYASFPPHKISERSNNNSWITPGIELPANARDFFISLLRTVMILISKITISSTAKL